jgi:hypothetical protein
MSINKRPDTEFSEMYSKFPLTPIEDDASYRVAIEILDRLFARDDLRTPAEMEYFRTLARMASEYELRRVAGHRPHESPRRAQPALRAGRLSKRPD